MATSSIFKNFIVEGKDAIDFANSLDSAFSEKEKRGDYVQKGIFTNDEVEIKSVADRIFANV